MKEQMAFACECGATVKASDIDGLTVKAVTDLWRVMHNGSGHQSVTCAEASTIRTAEKRRRRVKDAR
jgi:hypothetical protein